MNSYEYLSALRQALEVLPEDERKEAIRYYEDYFLDAGEQDAARIIEELGAPDVVAAEIVKEYRGVARVPQPERQSEQTAYAQHVQTDGWFERLKAKFAGNRNNTLLLILIVVISSPLWGRLLLGLGGGIIGVACAIAVVLLGCVALMVAIPILFMVVGIALLISILFLVNGSVAGVLMLVGGALVCIALALLSGILSIWIFLKCIPAMVNGIGNGFRWIVRKLQGGQSV